MPLAEVILGDCRDVLKTLEEDSFDSMVVDPPAGIAFRGAKWDTYTLDRFENFLTEVFTSAYKVLKPGAHILVWSIPRTSHRTACAIEGAGFNIRDGLDNVKDRSAEVQAFLESLNPEQIELLLRAGPADSFILHVFGSGMPKSLNVQKALTKAGSEEAAKWKSFGTALKPGAEIWWLARKPLQEETVIKQVLATGTGILNIDGCRVAGDMSELINQGTGKPRSGMGSHYNDKGGFGGDAANPPNPLGRWPSNFVLQHGPDCKNFQGTWECSSTCPVRLLNEQSGDRPGMSGGGLHKEGYAGGMFGGIDSSDTARNDFGGASRFFNQFEPDLEEVPFFYTGKVTPAERKEGFEGTDLVNEHPTQKTQKLMTHLVRLITPPGGRVLDPFAGSGSTIVAALEEGMSGVGIERDPEFHKIASTRVESFLKKLQSIVDFRVFFEE
jgi:DNA modification methylase